MTPLAKLFRRCAAALLALCCAGSALAYVVRMDDTGCVYAWMPGTKTLQIKLPAPSSPLIDGQTYVTSFQSAIQIWNNLVGAVQLTSTVAGTTTYKTNNGINEIVMDSAYDGTAFGSGTLAITVTYTNGDEHLESDIVFNTAYTWDSYRGNLRSGRQDLQRVAVHELGHVLDLDHPDQATPKQTVSAIMNSTISNVEIPQTDDINGAQSIYGRVGFIPANNNFSNAATLALNSGSTSVTGASINATAEPGEPAHVTGSPAARSVWWKWTPLNSGSATLTTLGSNFDTVLAVYTGSAVNALTKLASNDDVTAGVVRSSTVSFTVAANTSYYIAVDGWEGPFGQITLNATLTVDAASLPSITTQPSSTSVTTGGTATFSVAANGNPTTYQWYFGGNAVSGATASTLTLSNVTAANAGNYSVAVSNTAGTATSNSATLTVLASGLTAQTVTSGHGVSFTAANLTGAYQWQVSADSGVTWTNVANTTTYSGTTTSTLTISDATAAMNGYRYRYVVTGSGYTSTSNAATLTVAAVFFAYPAAITIDGAGNLYVGDSSTNTVHKINSSSAVITLAGASGTSGSNDGTGTAARFNQPGGITATSAGNLTVSDTANATLRSITTAGVVTTLAGSATGRGNTDATVTAATFSAPIGITQTSAGIFYVADSTNHTIRQISSGGVVTTLAGFAGSSGSTDATGSTARFNLPNGVAVDATGTLYVSDTTNNTIRKITAGGSVSTLAGTAGVSGYADGTGAGALFNRPTGLALDSAGTIYVADTGNSTIRKITAGGGVTTLAGLPTIGGMRDGTAGDAWFNQPKALVVDSSGNVYVADTGNAAIRKITASGAVTTLIFTAGTTTTPSTDTGGSGSGGTTTTPSTSSGGGGGGAMDSWIVAALGLLLMIHRSRARRC